MEDEEVIIAAEELELEDVANAFGPALKVELSTEQSASGELSTEQPVSAELSTEQSGTAVSFWECSGRYWLIVQSLLVVTGVVVGIASFIVMGFTYENYHAAAMALLSGIMALVMLHIQVLKIREKLSEWYDHIELKSIQRFAVASTIISLGGVATYLSLALVNHQDFESLGECFYPPTMFSFLIFIWSTYLFWFITFHIRKSKNKPDS